MENNYFVLFKVLVAIVPRIEVNGQFPNSLEDQLRATESFAEHLRDSYWYTPVSRSCYLKAIIVFDVSTKIVG